MAKLNQADVDRDLNQARINFKAGAIDIDPIESTSDELACDLLDYFTDGRYDRVSSRSLNRACAVWLKKTAK